MILMLNESINKKKRRACVMSLYSVIALHVGVIGLYNVIKLLCIYV